MEAKIGIITAGVNDLKTSIKFYREGPGLPMREGSDEPATETDWGGYSGYFQDPDGYLWEVAWNPHFWIE
jgi:catechol 2,3-dioxygenase-like lactoylglutathione lyase family enzyme